MEMMPAWTKWAKEEGLQEGLQEGMREGLREGMEKGEKKGRQEERQEIIRKLLDKGNSPEVIADVLEIPVDEVRKLSKH
ncbi:hypothetical protein [Paenibacillus ginsengihumi]|uniref:hypothetical protein n=1 Tax=Paenibacillus ginsengihumi TaxID=431596 RepID=UPI000380A7BA|nr:hypothetical protein [Paenibacillus ginsengihumi]